MLLQQFCYCCFSFIRLRRVLPKVESSSMGSNTGNKYALPDNKIFNLSKSRGEVWDRCGNSDIVYMHWCSFSTSLKCVCIVCFHELECIIWPIYLIYCYGEMHYALCIMNCEVCTMHLYELEFLQVYNFNFKHYH